MKNAPGHLNVHMLSGMKLLENKCCKDEKMLVMGLDQ